MLKFAASGLDEIGARGLQGRRESKQERRGQWGGHAEGKDARIERKIGNARGEIGNPMLLVVVEAHGPKIDGHRRYRWRLAEHRLQLHGEAHVALDLDLAAHERHRPVELAGGEVDEIL